MQAHHTTARSLLSSTATIIALMTAALWTGLSTAAGPGRLFLSFGCGWAPCQEVMEVFPNKPVETQRTLFLSEYLNLASLTVRLSEGKAIATVNWRTIPTVGATSKGEETVEITDLESSDIKLYRLSTGTGNDHDIFLITAQKHPDDFKTFLGDDAPLDAAPPASEQFLASKAQ